MREDDGTDRTIAPGALPADLVADTVEALQARRGEQDRDALRGTIDPGPRCVTSRARLLERRRD